LKKVHLGVRGFCLAAFLVALEIAGLAGCQVPAAVAVKLGPSLAVTVSYSAPSIPAKAPAVTPRLLLPTAPQVTATLTDSSGKATTLSQTVTGTSAVFEFPTVLQGNVTLSAQAYPSISSTVALFANSTTSTVSATNAAVTLYLLPVGPTVITSSSTPSGTLAAGTSVSFKYSLQSASDVLALAISPTSLTTYLQNSTGAPVTANASGVIASGGTDGTLYLTLYNTTASSVPYSLGLAESATVVNAVTYNPNGGSGAPPTDSTPYTQGQSVTVMGAGSLTKTGYTFAGWTTNATSSGASASYAPAASFTYGTSNVTLYAVWIPSTFNAAGGGSTISITGYSVAPTGALAIPPGITSIAYGAFLGCPALTSVSIPSSVTSIGDQPFADCIELAGIAVDSSNPDYESVAGALYDKAGDTLLQVPGLTNGSYIIASTVTTVGAGAFYGCAGLTSVTIPMSVTGIDNTAFFDCSSLTSINVSSPNMDFMSDSYGVLYDKAEDDLLAAPEGLTGAYPIPTGVTTIATDAFYNCTLLTSVTIPASVTTIEDQAFQMCSGLTTVTIPATVTTMGDEVFANCGLTSVTIGSGLVDIGQQTFFECFELTTVSIPSSVTSIDQGLFESCLTLTTVTGASGVTSIGDFAFYGCADLQTISLPGGLLSIGVDTFLGTGLTSVEIPSTVSTIGSAAFEDNYNLTSVTMDSSTPASGVDSTTFGGEASGFEILVPSGTASTYQAAAGWGSYASLITGS
jgi:uncharacterized repeat protein (TIGR02543 family)